MTSNFEAVTAPDPKDAEPGAGESAKTTDGLEVADKRKIELIARAIVTSVRGTFALNGDDLEVVLGHFQDVVHIEPSNAKYHKSLGTALHCMGRR